MSNNRHDDVFMEVLKEDRDVVTFLDSVFGFLYRCTDFFHLSDETATKLGFPAGVAKSVVQKTFERYERQTLYDEQLQSLNNVATSDSNVPAAVEEVEVQGEKKEPGITATAHLRKIDRSENYNGDDRGDYRWCQTLKDLDVRCNVVPTVCKAVQVKVNIESHHLKISANVEGDWCTLIDHSFPHKVNRNDCIWSLVPGDHIHVNLEKSEERWWDRLFTSDPAINTRTIDTTISTCELDPAEQMKIEELVHRRTMNEEASIEPINVSRNPSD